MATNTITQDSVLYLSDVARILKLTEASIRGRIQVYPNLIPPFHRNEKGRLCWMESDVKRWMIEEKKRIKTANKAFQYKKVSKPQISSIASESAPDIEEITKNSMEYRKVSGVYFLLKNKQIIYIGQSNDVLNRISCHSQGKDFDSYYVISVADERERTRLESVCIHKYQPPLNIVLPSLTD